MNFLIVDDHYPVRAMIRMVIKDWASRIPKARTWQIQECSSAEEALAVCTNYTPDVVTMDLRMEGMNGFSCIRRLRQMHPAAHIILVSQFVTDLLKSHSQTIGADAYVCKDDLGSLRDQLQVAMNIRGD